MAEALGGFYPGGMSNPHVRIVAFEGGYMLEPKKGEVDQAIAFESDIVEVPDERISKVVGGIVLPKTMADLYEL